MRYFLDCLYPPTREAATIMRDLGWDGLNVYIGGPRAAARGTWQKQDDGSDPVRDMADVFEFFVPTYVGRNDPFDPESSFKYHLGMIDGQDAINAAELCGFPSPALIMLDVEYGTWQAHPDATRAYIDGFVSTVNHDGRQCGIYSDMDTLGQLELGAEVDLLWGASWIPRLSLHRAPVGRFDPSLPPPWQAWQFGQVTIAGISCDANSAIDGFAGATWSPT